MPEVIATLAPKVTIEVIVTLAPKVALEVIVTLASQVTVTSKLSPTFLTAVFSPSQHPALIFKQHPSRKRSGNKGHVRVP